MLQEIAIAVFTQNPKLYQELADSVSGMGIPITQFAFRERMDSVQSWADESNLIAMFDANDEPEICLQWIRRLTENQRNTITLWIQRKFSQENTIEAVRAGAREVLAGKFNAEDVRSLISRAGNFFVKDRIPSTVLGVMGASGGAGTSTVAANLGVEIATLQSVPVGILDLDTFSSGVGLMLNLSPEITLFDLHTCGENIDSTVVKQAVVSHASGASLIASQGWPLDRMPIPENIVRRVILRMQQLFPYVLVDLPRELSTATRTVLDASDALLLVTPCSMVGATGAARVLQGLDSINYPQHQVHWVASSVSDPAGISPAQLHRVLSRKPVASIPFDPNTVNKAMAEGACLSHVAPRGAITKSVRKLASLVCESFGQSDTEDLGNRAPLGQTLSSLVGPSQAGTTR